MSAIRIVIAAAFVLTSGCALQSDEERQENLAHLEKEVTEAALDLQWELSDADVDPNNPLLTQEMVDALMALAAEEPCNIEGTMLGWYGQGELEFALVSTENQLVSSVEGTLEAQEADGGYEADSGELWSGVSEGEEGENGAAYGVMDAPMAPGYGTLTGALFNTADAHTGNVYGIWVDAPDLDGAWIFGGYSECT